MEIPFNINCEAAIATSESPYHITGQTTIPFDTPEAGTIQLPVSISGHVTVSEVKTLTLNIVVGEGLPMTVEPFPLTVKFTGINIAI